MAIFQYTPQDDPIGLFKTMKSAPSEHNFSLLQLNAYDGGVKSLNVPVCINIMAGGAYDKLERLSITSLSSKEHFHFEKAFQSEQTGLQPSGCIEMHSHDYFELMYVFDGEVEQYIENAMYHYEKGTACLMNRNTQHCEIVGRDYFLVFLCISKDFADEITRHLSQIQTETRLIYRFLTSNLHDQAQYQKDYLEFKPRLNIQDAKEHIDHMLDDLAQELLLKQPGHDLVEIALILRIFAALQKEYTSRHIRIDSSSETQLFNRVTHIMEKHSGRVSRVELSELLNYNSDYINRIVKKHTGLTLSEYNQVICLKKAEQRLIESSVSISKIISTLGFDNKTHFYKLFKCRHGMTPLEYRKRHQSKSEHAGDFSTQPGVASEPLSQA